jgi:hypothetical protein
MEGRLLHHEVSRPRRRALRTGRCLPGVRKFVRLLKEGVVFLGEEQSGSICREVERGLGRELELDLDHDQNHGRVGWSGRGPDRLLGSLPSLEGRSVWNFGYSTFTEGVTREGQLVSSYHRAEVSQLDSLEL